MRCSLSWLRFAVRVFEHLAEQAGCLGRVDSELPRCGDGGLKERLELVKSLSLHGVAVSGADYQRKAGAMVEHAFFFEDSVALAHGHRVEPEFLRQRPRGREFFPRLEHAAQHLEAYLLDDLPVYGHAAIRIDDYQHGPTRGSELV